MMKEKVFLPNRNTKSLPRRTNSKLQQLVRRLIVLYVASLYMRSSLSTYRKSCKNDVTIRYVTCSLLGANCRHKTLLLAVATPCESENGERDEELYDF
jgi:hypothetical protein